MRTLLVIAIFAALILGYGYYNAATRGWLYISLMDTSVRPYGANLRDAELRLLDGNRKLLADAKSDHKFGVVRLIHPEAGDCSAAEHGASTSSEARDQWRKCFQTLSTWLVDWVGHVRSADVKFAQCNLKAVPVTSHVTSGDWWLWWLPLPHIGGQPLTYFTLSINVNGANCTMADANVSPSGSHHEN
jgi:hypothetical protein